MLARCLALQERLANGDSVPGDAGSQGSSPSTPTTGGLASDAAPDVLDDVVRIATGGRGLADIGMKAKAPEPPPWKYDSIIPPVTPAPKPAAISREVSELPQRAAPLQSRSFQPEVPGPDQPSHPSQPSQLSASLAAGPDQLVLTAQQWAGEDDPGVQSYELLGFHREVLNRSFTADKVTRIRGRRSFWDKTRTVFMYWQEQRRRWALVQRWDRDKDLLEKVRAGEDLGWAFLKAPGLWTEFWLGSWTDVKVTTNQVFYPGATPGQQVVLRETPRHAFAASAARQESQRSLPTASPAGREVADHQTQQLWQGDIGAEQGRDHDYGPPHRPPIQGSVRPDGPRPPPGPSESQAAPAPEEPPVVGEPEPGQIAPTTPPLPPNRMKAHSSAMSVATKPTPVALNAPERKLVPPHLLLRLQGPQSSAAPGYDHPQAGPVRPVFLGAQE